MTVSRAVSLSVDEIRGRLRPCFDRLGIEKAILFGSFARGTQTRHSDIDLLVVMKTAKRYFDRYDDLTPVYEELAGYEIELLVHTPEELERNRERPFMQKILSEGVLIYGN